MKIIVDIDNSLWDFSSFLFDRISKVNKNALTPHLWNHWDAYREFCDLDDFLEAVRFVHMRQDHPAHFPYRSSSDFLKKIKELGGYITIASHRDSKSWKSTEAWLKKHDLVFDDLHISHDKTVLFDSHDAVFDDCPHTLDKACERGLIRAALLCPWNATLPHPLFNTHDEVLNFLIQEFSEKGVQ